MHEFLNWGSYRGSFFNENALLISPDWALVDWVGKLEKTSSESIANQGSDDHSNGPEGATPLALGQIADGAVNFTGDLDWFEVRFQAGDQVSLQFNSETPGTFAYLVNSFGDRIDYTGSGSNVIFQIEHGGTYYFVANNDDFSFTGAYSFSYDLFTDDHGGAAQTATSISIDGTLYNGAVELGEGRDQDWFAFTVSAGEVLSFDYQSLNGNGPLSFTLMRSFGDTLFALNLNEPGDTQQVTFDRAGTYYLVVESFFSEGVDYGFSVSEFVDDHSGLLSQASSLTVDGAAILGRADFSEDRDLFSFNVSAPGTVLFDITGVEGSEGYGLILYDSNGFFIDAEFLFPSSVSLGDGTSFEIEYAAWDVNFASAGDYNIMVVPLGFIGEEFPRDTQYALSARTFEDDVSYGFENAPTILLDGPAHSGELDFNGDADFVAVEVQAGQYFYVKNSLGLVAGPGLLQNLLPTDSATIIGTLGKIDGNQVFYVQGSGTYYHHVNSAQETSDTPYDISFVTVSANSTFLQTRGVNPVQTAVGQDLFFELTSTDTVSYFYEITVSAMDSIFLSSDLDFAVADTNFVIYSANGLQTIDSGNSNLGGAGFTFEEAGTYVIEVSFDPDPTFFQNPSYQATVSVENIQDDQPSGIATPTTLSLDGSVVASEIDFNLDQDWFKIEAVAGQIISLELITNAVNGGIEIDSVRMLDPSFDPITGFTGSLNDLQLGPVAPSQFTAPIDGTYYVVIAGDNTEATGTYTLSASLLTDDYSNDVSTTGTIAVDGGVVVAEHEGSNDADWFAVDFTEGEAYQIKAFYNAISLSQTEAVLIYNALGEEVARFESAEAGLIDYVALESGTHYISVDSFLDAGEYTLEVASFEALGQTPSVLDAFALNRNGTPEPNNIYDIYFAGFAEEFWSDYSLGWSQQDIDAVMAVFDVIEDYLNIEFRFTDVLPNAELVLMSNGFGATYSRQWDFSHPFEVTSLPFGLGNNALAGTEGSFAFATILHGLVRALGVGLPHDNFGNTDILPGAFGPFDLGVWDLNQAVYSVTSFNDGWQTGPNGLSKSGDFGWQASPMAIDIAVLQNWFGANETANLGNNVYSLASLNDPGTGYTAIWDTGGQDTIAFSGADNATIDLRAATLAIETGGGGFVSYVDGVWGGFTIANGVVIENAQGGSGNDLIMGNEVGNVLDGGAGGDTIDGGAGNDVIFGGDQNDNLFGGDGNDQVLGQRGADFLYGGAGNDLVLGGNRNDRLFGEDGNDRVFGGNDQDIVSGGAGRDIVRGGNGDDLLNGDAGNDVMFGGTGRDMVNGGEGDDFLSGRGGFDILNGGAGNDTLEGGVQADQFIFEGAFGNDTITDFAATNNAERIHLSDVEAITDFQDLVDNHISQVGADVVISDGLGNTITILGVNLSDLDAVDFVF